MVDASGLTLLEKGQRGPLGKDLTRGRQRESSTGPGTAVAKKTAHNKYT